MAVTVVSTEDIVVVVRLWSYFHRSHKTKVGRCIKKTTLSKGSKTNKSKDKDIDSLFTTKVYM